MRLLKVLSLAAIAALTMSSCSQDQAVEPVSNEAISFRTVVPTSTRGNESTLDAMQKNTAGFRVYALKSDGSVYFDENATWNTTSSTWTTGQNRLWPSGQTLSFHAFYPPLQVNPTSTGTTITNFVPHKPLAAQNDIIYAYNSLAKPANNSIVPLNFRHATAQIEVKAKNSDANKIVKVIGIRMGNFKEGADLTMNAVNTGTQYIDGAGVLPTDVFTWATPTTLSNYATRPDRPATGETVPGSTVIKATPVELTTTAQSLMFKDGNAFIIPQTTTAWNGQITDAAQGTTSNDGAYIALLVQYFDTNSVQLFSCSLILPNFTVG